MSESINPFGLLNKLASIVNQCALPLPERSIQDDSWQGIAFQLEDATMLIDMNNITEVSPQPAVTRLPGVKRWVRGIANVRGEVLTLVDLHEFFELRGGTNPASNHVIAIVKGDTRLGVIVDRVIGMRQIESKKVRKERSEECPESMKDCVSGAVYMDESWMDIFDPEKLINNKKFLNLSTLLGDQN